MSNKLREMFDDNEELKEPYKSWIAIAEAQHECSVCGHYISAVRCNGSETFICELTGESFPNNKGCASWITRRKG